MSASATSGCFLSFGIAFGSLAMAVAVLVGRRSGRVLWRDAVISYRVRAAGFLFFALAFISYGVAGVLREDNRRHAASLIALVGSACIVFSLALAEFSARRAKKRADQQPS